MYNISYIIEIYQLEYYIKFWVFWTKNILKVNIGCSNVLLIITQKISHATFTLMGKSNFYVRIFSCQELINLVSNN